MSETTELTTGVESYVLRGDQWHRVREDGTLGSRVVQYAGPELVDALDALATARRENETMREALELRDKRDREIAESLFWLTAYEWDENGMEESGNTEAVLYWDRDDVRGIVLSLDGKAVGLKDPTGAGSTPATIPVPHNALARGEAGDGR